LDIDIAQLAKSLGKLAPEAQAELFGLFRQFEQIDGREKARTSFLTFVKAVWPGFIEGSHHRIMAEAFERVASGKLRRLIINMPPRHTKSEFASYLFPAWYLGQYPSRKVIQASHTADLSVGFGRKVRNLVGSKEFNDIFSGVGLRADSKAAGQWITSKNGEYYAVGVGGALAGRGADLMVIDDPHSEQDAMSGEHDPTVWDDVWDWYTSGPRQRLQPSGAIVIVMTRWHKRDLTGLIINSAAKRDLMNEWEIIELPAIMESGNSLWPGYWSVEELTRLKDETPPHKWAAQYQQNPTSAEGALIKRDWWKLWDKPKLPPCTWILQSWDTAHTANQRSNYSACTTWGVFERENSDGKVEQHLILLDAFRDRIEFPNLKVEAIRLYKQWKPDQVIIETKSAGDPLYHELRRTGVPVANFTPTRGNDKVARVNSITDIFRSGRVWTPDAEWADAVIQECNDFPVGAHDDYVDTVSQALIRFRTGGFVRTDQDEDDDDDTVRRYQPNEPYY
jgi:predicted phage terminase large subunit-like protein